MVDQKNLLGLAGPSDITIYLIAIYFPSLIPVKGNANLQRGLDFVPAVLASTLESPEWPWLCMPHTARSRNQWIFPTTSRTSASMRWLRGRFGTPGGRRHRDCIPCQATYDLSHRPLPGEELRLPLRRYNCSPAFSQANPAESRGLAPAPQDYFVAIFQKCP